MVDKIADDKKKIWPGYSTEAHPEVFNTIPPQLKIKKPWHLTDDQISQYFREGYVIVPQFLTRDELEPVKDSIGTLVEELAQKLYKGGNITKLYSEYGLFRRLTMIDREFPGANIVLHKNGRLPQSFRDLWANTRLLDVCEQLLGSADIVGHPAWNLRTKTPDNEATTVPWHQDCSYFDNDSYKVLIASAWIPFLDVNETNGCLELARRGHRKGRVAMHQCCSGSTLYTMMPEEEFKNTLEVDLKTDKVVCEIPYGGVLFFNNLVPHRSLPNKSNDIRWSIDFRWLRADKPLGFWGLMDGVRLRSSTDPDMKIDWEKFDNVNRSKASSKFLASTYNEFDTTIPGPWMDKWEIVNRNAHTAAHDLEGSVESWKASGMVTG